MKKVIAEYPHKIYITLTGQKRAPYRIWYSQQGSDGKVRRVYISSSTRAEAEKIASRLVKEVEDSGLSLGKILSKEEKAAIQQYQHSDPSLPLADLIKDGIRKSFSNRSKWTVEQAVEHFVVEWKKKNQGISRSEIYQKSMKRHLNRFSVDFSGRQMFSLTLNEVREWRDSLSSLSQKILTAKVRNDYLSDVKRLFSYCDLSTIEKLEFLPKGVPEKDFYTIEEVQKILDILRPHKEKAMHRCYATAVLCLFAGLRQSEALVLDWNVINKALRSSVEKKSFVVTDSKTGSRQVFMNETLIKWLEIVPSQERQGKIFKTTSTSEQGKQDAFSDSFRNAVKGIRVIKNGLRHSCATYLVAINNNYDAVARQMGHTVSMQKKHYMRAITYEEAMAYWNLTPFSEIEGIEFAAKEEIRKKEKEAVVALLDEEDEKKKDALIEHMQDEEGHKPFMDMLENPEDYVETMPPPITTNENSSCVSGISNEQIADRLLEQSRISKQKEWEILEKIDTLGDGKTWIDEDDVTYSKSTILASREERKEVRKIIKELEEGKFNPFDAESMKNERGRGEIFIRSSERSTDEN